MAKTIDEAGIAPVRKTLTVPLSLEKAFRLFTADIASWWPLATHSVAEGKAETVIMEGRVGGRFYERTSDGRGALWGEVRVWDPPRRLVYSWHPGRAAESGTGGRTALHRRGQRHARRARASRLGSTGRERRLRRATITTTGWNRVFNECYGKAAGALLSQRSAVHPQAKAAMLRLPWAKLR